MVKKTKIQKKTVFNVTILLIAVLLLLAFRNLLPAIFSGLVLAYVFYPIFDKLTKKTKHELFSASLTVALASIIVVVPLIVLTSILVTQGMNVYSYFQNVDLLAMLKTYISNPVIVDYLDNFVANGSLQKVLSTLIESSISTLTKGLHSTIGYVSNFVLSIFIGIAVMFFALLDRGKFVTFLESFLPFSKKNRKKLVKQTRKIIRTVIYGEIPVAMIQGAIGGIGFAIFGLSGAVLWAIVMAILSFIPFVAAPLVWVPASIYLYFAKGPLIGLGMFLYGVVIISSTDNILRMKIFDSLGRIHPLITLFGVILGVSYLGIVGLIIGPLFLSLFVSVLHIMKEEKF